MDIDLTQYNQIAAMIASDESPVGIDAKKTHIYIIHKLHQIEEKLERLEKQMNQNDSGD